MAPRACNALKWALDPNPLDADHRIIERSGRLRVADLHPPTGFLLAFHGVALCFYASKLFIKAMSLKAHSTVPGQRPINWA
jgi:hypothetical protein